MSYNNNNNIVIDTKTFYRVIRQSVGTGINDIDRIYIRKFNGNNGSG